jgi:hypothetical protein
LLDRSPSPDPGSPQKAFISRKVFGSPQKDDDDRPRTFTIPSNPFEDCDDDFSVTTSRFRKPKVSEIEEPPATQVPVFRRFEVLEGFDDDNLVHEARKIISDKAFPVPADLTFDDEFPTMTQLARCPMCNQAVNPDELRVIGDMNTRQQEKFCRSHQKKTAMQDWELNDYPEIDWENLTRRIAKHHSFIKELVNGKECHSRQALDETVKAGKDRTLLKMTSNLTPGYYGSRGLREISEAIMKDFTPLLKRRIVEDRLMAARGVTGFVQSVLVPEVTVLLIMEDMNVNIERAREVLTDSVGIGELVNDEIRDVVAQRVEDSEDDDEC